MAERVETVIVGAGQAGLAMSRQLAWRGREHVVLERARVAERWRSQRWDTLRFQSPNWSLELPGQRYAGPDPDAFAHKDEVVRFLEAYAHATGAPIRSGVEVLSLEAKGAAGFRLDTTRGAYEARNVVVATGPYQVPRVPPLASRLPPGVRQLHAGDYRSPAALGAGAVLIVGSGTSGCQIGEELLQAGFRVHLSVGRHGRVPRRHRGRDLFWWRRALGYLDRRAADTPKAQRPPALLMTGAAGGHDVDLRAYARDGMVLLGRLRDIQAGRVVLDDDLEANLSAGDRAYDRFVAEADRHDGAAGGPARPASASGALRSPQALDLAATDIRTVIWTTGYTVDFRWIRLPLFGPDGEPSHDRGVTAVRGLYFLGLPWLHKFKSSFLFGVGEDAEHLAERIVQSGARRGRATTKPPPHPTPA